MNSNRNIILPLLLALAVGAGVLIGVFLNKDASVSHVDLVNTLGISSRTSKIEDILRLVDAQYVDTVDVAKIEEDVIPDMLKELDPHTVYIPASELKQVNEELSSEFGGIGVQFSIQNDTIMVVAVVSGGPSEKIGILPGDRIVSVNDSVIAGVGVTNNSVLTLLKGEMGTMVNVGILRRNHNEVLKFDIKRGEIPIYSVDVSYMINNDVGYIKVSRFAQKTFQEFMTAIVKLKQEGCKKLIIDLRGNTGGYLEVAINMCNEFLNSGDLIVYTKGKAFPREEVRATGQGTSKDIPLIVLIDEFSASASEIFSGAMQDNDRGVVVGRRSFGKGLVQTQVTLRDSSALRLTISRYYTPSGRCIQKPYNEGLDEYNMDIYERYAHGEFFNKDSIHVNDSLVYKTKLGRTVYGGGGIMPDYFVPRDTTYYSNFYFKISNNAMMYKFALQYADNNRVELDKIKDGGYKAIEKYLYDNDVLDKFIAFTKDEGVKFNSKQFNTSKDVIECQLHALIARNLIDEEGFYPIIYRVDDELQKAVELSEKEPNDLLHLMQ